MEATTTTTTTTAKTAKTAKTSLTPSFPLNFVCSIASVWKIASPRQRLSVEEHRLGRSILRWRWTAKPLTGHRSFNKGEWSRAGTLCHFSVEVDVYCVDVWHVQAFISEAYDIHKAPWCSPLHDHVFDIRMLKLFVPLNSEQTMENWQAVVEPRLKMEEMSWKWYHG